MTAEHSFNKEQNRNIKIIMFLGSKVRRVRRANNLTAIMSRLSRQCGIFNISQPYRPPRPVTGTALHRDQDSSVMDSRSQ
jgi:hypothetical protein